MRKYISVILIFIFLIDIGGYYLWFCIRQNQMQQEIRQEIRKGLQPDQLTLIVDSGYGDPEIIWIETNKEFRYKGEMYDVVSVQVKNQKKLYYCIQDDQEKQLISNYQKTHSAKKDSGKKLSEFKFQYIPQPHLWAECIYSVDFTPFLGLFRYKSQIIDINSPPPELI